MFTIIKHIPNDLSIVDLQELIRPIVEKRRWFKKPGQINSIKIMMRVFRDGRDAEFHALVRVSSEEAQKSLIQTINKKIANSKLSLFDNGCKSTCAAEFVIRHHSRDRRVGIAPKTGPLRIRKERRVLASKFVTISEFPN